MAAEPDSRAHHQLIVRGYGRWRVALFLMVIAGWALAIATRPACTDGGGPTNAEVSRTLATLERSRFAEINRQVQDGNVPSDAAATTQLMSTTITESVWPRALQSEAIGLAASFGLATQELTQDRPDPTRIQKTFGMADDDFRAFSEVLRRYLAPRGSKAAGPP